MNDKLQRVARTAIAGFVTGAITALSTTQVDWVNVNLDVLRVVGAAVFSAGVAGAWSAIHNFILDPSPVPSLAPAPTIPVPNDKDPQADGDDNDAGADGIPVDEDAA